MHKPRRESCHATTWPAGTPSTPAVCVASLCKPIQVSQGRVPLLPADGVDREVAVEREVLLLGGARLLVFVREVARRAEADLEYPLRRSQADVEGLLDWACRWGQLGCVRTLMSAVRNMGPKSEDGVAPNPAETGFTPLGFGPHSVTSSPNGPTPCHATSPHELCRWERCSSRSEPCEATAGQRVGFWARCPLGSTELPQSCPQTVPGPPRRRGSRALDPAPSRSAYSTGSARMCPAARPHRTPPAPANPSRRSSSCSISSRAAG